MLEVRIDVEPDGVWVREDVNNREHHLESEYRQRGAILRLEAWKYLRKIVSFPSEHGVFMGDECWV